tara:strand:- start:3757 stop:4338 length:582 start_codon:yes stop_codon:yes gene_type:complete
MTIEIKKTNELDITKCRKLKPYSQTEYIGRILWTFASPFFKYSPRPFFAWRRLLLRLFGAKIGTEAHVDPTAKIYLPWKLILGDQSSIGENAIIYNLGLITIGHKATISQRVHLCAGTHNYNDLSMQLLRQPIEIGSQAWICADAFIGPNVSIGESSVIGAASVVVKNIPPMQVFAGNPAVFVKKRLFFDNSQ